MTIKDELVVEAQKLCAGLQFDKSKELIGLLASFTGSFIDDMSEEDYLSLRIAMYTVGKISISWENRQMQKVLAQMN